MAKFELYKGNSKSFFAFTDNYVFAEKSAREETKNGQEITIKRDGQPVAVFIGEYEITTSFRGCSIRKKNEYGRFSYLKSIYKGQAIFVEDFLYEKTYKTIYSAKNTIKKLQTL